MKLIQYIFSLLVLLAIVSCSPNYYLPTAQKVMVFEEKGDVILSGSLGFHDQIGLEAGYAFTNNIGIYTSFNRFDISKYGNTNLFIKDFIWDTEAIFYKRFNGGFYTGLNVGAGFGKFNCNNPYYDLGLTRQFIQPSVGITIFDNIELALSSRFTHLKYNLKLPINSSDYDRDMSRIYFDLTDVAGTSYYFIEPAFTLGLSYEFCKIKFQYTRAVNTGERKYFYQNESLSTILSFNINKLFFDRMDKTKKLRWSF